MSAVTEVRIDTRAEFHKRNDDAVTDAEWADGKTFQTRNAARRFGYAIAHRAKPPRCGKCKRDLLDGEPVYWAVTRTGYGMCGGWSRHQGYICADCRGPIVQHAPLWSGHQPDRWEARACEQCGRQCHRRVGFSRNDWGERKHVFCCDNCAAAYHRAPRVAAAAAARRKVCTVCGTTFDALRRDAETCSPACRQKAYRKRMVREAAP